MSPTRILHQLIALLGELDIQTNSQIYGHALGDTFDTAIQYGLSPNYPSHRELALRNKLRLSIADRDLVTAVTKGAAKSILMN